MDLKLPGILGSDKLPAVFLHLVHADTAHELPIYHCGDEQHQGRVEAFAEFAFEVVPSADIDVKVYEERGHKKAKLVAFQPTDTIRLIFKAMGSCRKSKVEFCISHQEGNAGVLRTKVIANDPLLDDPLNYVEEGQLLYPWFYPRY